MARRLTSPERQRQILNAAVRHFASRGFSGTKTKGIAQECGVTEALLFQHFPNKKALYRRILDTRMGHSDREIFPPLASFRGDDEAFLTFVASGLLARMESEPLFTRLLLYSALERHDLARSFVKQRVRRSVGYLARWLDAGQRAGRLRKMKKTDTTVAARAFLGMAVHHSLLTHLFDHPLSPARSREDLARIWARLFLYGMRTQRP